MAPGISLRKGAEPYPGYRLALPLGRGGWGEVWRAERTDGTSWALKFLPSDSQLAAAQEIRALQAIRSLHHPNLLGIDQVWSCPGYLVIVMELAEGNLLDLLQIYLEEFGAPILADHLCYYLRQAAEAIDFLNARQHMIDGRRVAFRHCDIKPSNLLVQGRNVKVADFSLAVQTTSSIGYHRRVGTVQYAGPELFHGWLSDRTDQYALAVSYVQLRTGDFPFHDNPSRFRVDYVRPVPDLSSLNPSEQTILKRALAPTPQDRWPSCTEMMDQLADAVRVPCLI